MRRDKDTDTGDDYNIVEFSDQWCMVVDGRMPI